MNSIMFSIAPLMHLILFSCLLGLWVVLIYRPNRSLEEIGTRAGTYLALIYLAWIIGLVFWQKRIPVLNFSQMLILLGALIWWGQNFVQRRVRQRMLVIFPLAAVIVLLTSSLIIGVHPGEVQSVLKSNSAAFHISLSLAGIAFLLGSGVFGTGQLLLHRQIKSRNFGRLFQFLPPLGDLNRLRQIALLSGWWLFTISMISAFLWMYIEASAEGPVVSHLHPMLTLWVVISLSAAASRFNWLSQRRLAFSSAVLALLVFVLLLVSVIEIYSRGVA
ncbi:MAG: hypothetical protein HN356_05000 [Calditrichaeota bacterium]|nr:hypothetical protein [Calditrichota bacterium]MBT7615727.1 hypothetical protein [Calditrichota bacterium]